MGNVIEYVVIKGDLILSLRITDRSKILPKSSSLEIRNQEKESLYFRFVLVAMLLE
jgi:hypothetical protein